MIHALGFVVLLFSFLAYVQTNRKKFLILNTMAIAAVAGSFWMKGGYVGFFAETFMFIIHIAAILYGDKIHKNLSFTAAGTTFLVTLALFHHNLHNSTFDLFMPIALSLFALGAYQKEMENNKIIFAFGLLLLSAYSISVEAYFVAVSNLIGIGLNIISYSQIISEKEHLEKMKLSRV